MRFPDKERHQIFLEPEGLDAREIYVNGFSMSLPRDVQAELVHALPGLEDAVMLRPGYAVEYDFIQPTELTRGSRRSASPVCFSPGRSTARPATRRRRRRDWSRASTRRIARVGASAAFELRRDEAYIGILVDDLITKGCLEPYRMFTSRAEHRLLLRIDNADLRLTPRGRAAGLVDDERWERFCERKARFERNCGTLDETLVRAPSGDRVPASQLLRQPEVRSRDLIAERRSAALRASIRHRGARYRQRRDDGQVRGLLRRQESEIERRAEGRAAADSRGLPVRPRSRPVARGRPAAVAGPAGHARPGAADSRRNAGGRRGSSARTSDACSPDTVVTARRVTSREFSASACSRRARKRSSVRRLTDEVRRRQLETYFRLLAQWNRKINLTALPLAAVRPTRRSTGCSSSRSLAAEHRRRRSSHAGSISVRRRLPRDSAEDRCVQRLALTMVESKTRKAAFCAKRSGRWACRTPTVENMRVRGACARPAPAGCDLVDGSCRPAGSTRRCLTSPARLLQAWRTSCCCFSRPTQPRPITADLRAVETRPAVGTASSRQASSASSVNAVVFHVEQSRLTAAADPASVSYARSA